MPYTETWEETFDTRGAKYTLKEHVMEQGYGIANGKEKFAADPDKWEYLYYQSNMVRAALVDTCVLNLPYLLVQTVPYSIADKPAGGLAGRSAEIQALRERLR